MSKLAERVVARAVETQTKIATAESCTGGMIAAALTDIPGSSAAFDRGFVTYSNEAKADLLGVPIEHTENPGAVSGLVAEEMVLGALVRSRANLAVAVTGIAGPGGGTAEKPIGLVYIAVRKGSTPVVVQEFRFGKTHKASTRKEVRQLTVKTALEMLLDAMK